MNSFLSQLRILSIFFLFFKFSCSISLDYSLNYLRNLKHVKCSYSGTYFQTFNKLSASNHRNALNHFWSSGISHNLNIFKEYVDESNFKHKHPENKTRLGTYRLAFITLTHLRIPSGKKINYVNNGENWGSKPILTLYALPNLPKTLIHEDILPDFKHPDPSDPNHVEDDYIRGIFDENLRDEVPVDDVESSEGVEEQPNQDTLNKRAKKLWERYKHVFKPMETLEEKEARISKLPVTKIKVQGVEIEVRMGSPGLPWYIDLKNMKKLESTFDPDALNAIYEDKSYENLYFPIIKENAINEWVPLPGIAATYFPKVKVLDHKENIPDYEYVTLLHDGTRNYTWTYQRSTHERAKEFGGEGKLDTYEVVEGKVIPMPKDPEEGPKPYVPKDYFSIQKNPTQFYPRKTLDLGVFRQPKMDDLLTKKFRYFGKPYEKGQFGYHRGDQSFWKTVEYRDNGDKPGMRYRELGKTGIRVSEVGLGTMTFGSSVSEAQSHELMDYAYDKFGLNLFDTCELYPVPFSFSTYGNTERILGNWIRRRGDEVRSKVVVSARITCRNDNLKLIRNSSDTSLSKKNILNAVDGCLKRMGLDYIDLLQFSWPDRYVPIQETGDFDQVLFDVESMNDDKCVRIEEQVEAIDELIKAGKVRAWGVSNETPWGLLEFYRLAQEMNVPPPCTAQVNYNLLCRNEVEKGFVEIARPQNTGVGIIAYGPLAGGILTGKYLEFGDTTTSGRLLRFPSIMTRLRGSLAARAVREYHEIAMTHQLPNLTVMALKWVYSRPFIFSTIIGANDLYQLRENLHCLDPDLPITDLMERRINQVHWKWRDPIRIVQ